MYKRILYLCIEARLFSKSILESLKVLGTSDPALVQQGYCKGMRVGGRDRRANQTPLNRGFTQQIMSARPLPRKRPFNRSTFSLKGGHNLKVSCPLWLVDTLQIGPNNPLHPNFYIPNAGSAGLPIYNIFTMYTYMVNS